LACSICFRSAHQASAALPERPVDIQKHDVGIRNRCSPSHSNSKAMPNKSMCTANMVAHRSCWVGASVFRHCLGTQVQYQNRGFDNGFNMCCRMLQKCRVRLGAHLDKLAACTHTHCDLQSMIRRCHWSRICDMQMRLCCRPSSVSFMVSQARLRSLLTSYQNLLAHSRVCQHRVAMRQCRNDCIIVSMHVFQ
jgi:hypothetical protein